LFQLFYFNRKVNGVKAISSAKAVDFQQLRISSAHFERSGNIYSHQFSSHHMLNNRGPRHNDLSHT